MQYSSKTSTVGRPKAPSAPVQTVEQDTITFEGDLGWSRDAKSELFQLGVTFMGESQDTFYEAGDARHARFVALIHSLTATDPTWVASFIEFLRTEAFLRTASVVAAIEYAVAGGPGSANVIVSALHRADEPMEALGYYFAKHGRRIPQRIKKGIARAAVKLFNEYSLRKYDIPGRGIRAADVINLTHPKPKDNAQSALFKYALDRRYSATFTPTPLLPQITAAEALAKLPEGERREYIRKNEGALKAAGMTWERLSSWLPGGLDAEAWEAVIPSMGYMALLRNLRNFDQAGISTAAVDAVCRTLENPEAVAKSMQFPYRFLSAYKEVPSVNYTRALERALDLSVSNIPRLPGKSLILVDVSRSMNATMGRSKMKMWEAGAVFGAAQALRCGDGSLVAFATGNQEVRVPKGGSILKIASALSEVRVNHGTEVWPAIQAHWSGHDRIFIFTDMQSAQYSYRETMTAQLKKAGVKIYNFNLMGYSATNMDVGKGGVYELGGLSDVTFCQIPLLEAGRDAAWPWEI